MRESSQGFDSENPKPYRWLSRFLDRLSKEKGFQKVKVPRRPGTNATTVAIRLVKSDESGIGMSFYNALFIALFP